MAAGTNIGIDVTKAGTNRVATIKYTGTAGGGDITEVKVTAPITGGGTTGAVTIGVSSATNAAEGVVQLAATDQRTRGGNTTRAMTPADVWKAADAWVKGGENITLTSTAPVLTGNNAADPKLTLDWDGFTIDSQSNKVRTLVAGDNLTASDPTGAGGSTTLSWDGFKVKDNVGIGNDQGDKTGVKYIKPGTNIKLDYASGDSSVTISSTASSTITYANTTQAQAATATNVVMSPARTWDAVSSFF